jgi:hypothetical protein
MEQVCDCTLKSLSIAHHMTRSNLIYTRSMNEGILFYVGHGRCTPKPALLITWNGRVIVSSLVVSMYFEFPCWPLVQDWSIAWAWMRDSSQTILAFFSEKAGAMTFWCACHDFPSLVTRLGPNLWHIRVNLRLQKRRRGFTNLEIHMTRSASQSPNSG